MSDDAMNRIVVVAMHQSRDNALSAAIELCEEFARTGHSAACCVKALKDFRDMLPPSPDSMQ